MQQETLFWLKNRVYGAGKGRVFLAALPGIRRWRFLLFLLLTGLYPLHFLNAQSDTLTSTLLLGSEIKMNPDSIKSGIRALEIYGEANRYDSGDLTLLENHRPQSPYPAKKKPGFLLVGKKKWIRYNPVNLTFGGMLFLYQSVISSQISADCPYEISCSNFSKQSIIEYGLIKGLALSADRLTRCTKLAAKDLHPLRINENGMIIDHPVYYSNKHRH